MSEANEVNDKTQNPSIVNPTKVESHSADDDELDEAKLNEIDKELMSLDPQLSNDMASITNVVIENSDLEIESLDPAVSSVEDEELSSKKIWLVKLIPFYPKIKSKFRSGTRILKTKIFHFFTYQIPEFLSSIISVVKVFFANRKKNITEFFSLPVKSKILFLLFFIFFIGGLSFLYYFWKVSPLSKQTEIFLTNFENLSSETITFDFKKDMEPFFHNFRLSQNIFTTERLVVNLRPSPNSGPNPMAAVELFLSGTSSDVVVEIKDREAEMKDVILRTIEDFTFDDIVSQQGKQNLTEKISRALNSVLTKGKVKAVYYKSVIFKP